MSASDRGWDVEKGTGTVESLTVVPGGHKEANECEKKNRIKFQACDLYARGLLEPGGREQRSGKR